MKTLNKKNLKGVVITDKTLEGLKKQIDARHRRLPLRLSMPKGTQKVEIYRGFIIRKRVDSSTTTTKYETAYEIS